MDLPTAQSPLESERISPIPGETPGFSAECLALTPPGTERLHPNEEPRAFSPGMFLPVRAPVKLNESITSGERAHH